MSNKIYYLFASAAFAIGDTVAKQTVAFIKKTSAEIKGANILNRNTYRYAETGFCRYLTSSDMCNKTSYSTTPCPNR